MELDPRLADFPVSRTRQYLLLTLKNEAEFLEFIAFFFCDMAYLIWFMLVESFGKTVCVCVPKADQKPG